MSKKALGKGLDALIHTEDSETGLQPGVVEIPLDQIDSMDSQPRKRFAEEPLHELAASIRENGVIQPIIVEQTGDRYRVIAGERRLRAAKLAGLQQIPVIVRSYPSENLLQIALIENIQRENLNPVEEAAAYDTLLKETHLKQEELANRVGKSRSAIANSLRLLKLPPEMQDELVAGVISPGHARAILAVDNPAEQEAVFAEIVEKGLSVREAEKLAEKKNRQTPRAKEETPERQRQRPAELNEIEQRLLEALGTKVQIKGSLDSGRIEVSYFSPDDLDRLIELLLDR